MDNLTNNIDNYISGFPKEVQILLEQIRATISNAAPGAEEAIKYAMPTFVLNGNLVHFAAFKNHIGFYPVPSAILEFEEELSGYKRSKGAIQFPLNQPLPLSLITKIVEFRVKENLGKAVKKKKN
jgi:uncharacterized protein YdhG (YjbR/CyaY superfamily)